MFLGDLMELCLRSNLKFPGPLNLKSVGNLAFHAQYQR